MPRKPPKPPKPASAALLAFVRWAAQHVSLAGEIAALAVIGFSMLGLVTLAEYLVRQLAGAGY